MGVQTTTEQQAEQVSECIKQAIQDAQPTPINESIDNSLIPSIKEIERFMLYLNKRFSLNLPNNIIVNIQDTKPSTKGFYMPKECEKAYINSVQTLNYICLSSLHLKNTPYETIAHETAHFYNSVNKIKDASKSGYHNKKFKSTAEMLLLEVSKLEGKGYAITKPTQAFNDMLNDYKPDISAFHIQQGYKEREGESKSRNLLFMCSCGVKIRTAKNEDKPLKAICEYCKSEFIEVIK
jgi:hypothetical protein